VFGVGDGVCNGGTTWKGRGEEGGSVRGREGLKTEEVGGRRRNGLKREAG
jgi:hypothetical protein